jgi:hypothetical protein
MTYAAMQRRSSSSTVAPPPLSPLQALSREARDASSPRYRVPFEDHGDFQASVEEAEAQHPGSYPNVTGDQMRNAFNVYQGARNPSLGSMVLGRLVPDSNEQQPGIDDPLRANFGEMNESSAGGSVMNSPQWNLLMNDALVLGTAHSGQGTYMASPRTPGNILSRQHGMTVTGRELTGLRAFGHEFVQGHPALGEATEVSDPEAARSATFGRYQHVLRGSRGADGALRSDVLDELTAPPRSVGGHE